MRIRTGRGGDGLGALFGERDVARVLRDFATYLPTQVIPAAAGFIVLPILTRKLAPTEVGVLTVSQTLITFGWTIIGSWLAAAIIRELPAHRERGDMVLFRRTLWRGLGAAAVALAAFAAVMALGAMVSGTIRGNYVYILAAMAGLTIQNVGVSLFTASLRPRAYALTEVSARVGGIGIGIYLVFHGYRVHGYLLGLACASLAVGTLGVLAAWPRTRPGTSTSRRPDLGPWLHYGLPLSTAAIAVWGLNFIDRYILAALKSESAVGVYAVGNAIGDRMVMVPVLAFFTAATPLLMTAFEQHGRERVERMMASYTRIILLLGLPSIALIAVIARRIVNVLPDKDYVQYYQGAVHAAPIVAGGSLIFGLASISNIGLAVARRTRPLIYSTTIGLTVNVVANFALIPPFGVLGAAIATPIGMGAYLVAVQFWARGYAVWRFPLATLVRGAAAAALGGAVASIVVSDATRSRYAIPLMALVGAAVYAAVLTLLGEWSSRHPVARSIAASPKAALLSSGGNPDEPR